MRSPHLNRLCEPEAVGDMYIAIMARETTPGSIEIFFLPFLFILYCGELNVVSLSI